MFIVFILANLLMLPLGWACIKASARILRLPRNVLMPIILVFCIVGAFAINNAHLRPLDPAGLRRRAWLLEENDFPIAPVILGMLLGKMLEENFITSMIKSDGSWLRLRRAADRRRRWRIFTLAGLGRLGLDGLAAPATAHATRRSAPEPMNDISIRYDAAALTALRRADCCSAPAWPSAMAACGRPTRWCKATCWATTPTASRCWPAT